MKRTRVAVLLMLIGAAINGVIGCSEQQSPSSPQQTPVAPVASVTNSPAPTAMVYPQVPEVVHQPRLIWVPPATWATAKGEQSSFVPLGEMLTTNWAVVLDNSGSMKSKECSGSDNRMVAGGKAVINFARQRSDKDNFALVLFTNNNPYAQVAMPLGRDRLAFNQVVQGASPDFNTPLGPSIEVAYGELFTQARRQNWHGVYHIVVVTDGDWNQGPDPGPIVKRIVDGSPVQIHTVGFCTGSGHRLNIAGYTTYASAENAAELNAGLQAVLKAESETFVPQAHLESR